MAREPSHRDSRHPDERSPEHSRSHGSGQSTLPQMLAAAKPRAAVRALGTPSGKSRLEAVSAHARPQVQVAARPSLAPVSSEGYGQAVSRSVSGGAAFVSRVSGQSQLRSVVGRPMRIGAAGMTSGESRLRKHQAGATRATERSTQ